MKAEPKRRDTPWTQVLEPRDGWLYDPRLCWTFSSPCVAEIIDALKYFRWVGQKWNKTFVFHLFCQYLAVVVGALRPNPEGRRQTFQQGHDLTGAYRLVLLRVRVRLAHPRVLELVDLFDCHANLEHGMTAKGRTGDRYACDFPCPGVLFLFEPNRYHTINKWSKLEVFSNIFLSDLSRLNVIVSNGEVYNGRNVPTLLPH